MKKILIVFTFLIIINISNVVNAQPFTDDDNFPDWAKSSIYKLVDLEVLSGNSDGSFAPNRLINRAEFCKMLVKATHTEIYHSEKNSFPDVKSSDWFYDFVETAKQNGWVKGYPNGTFKPGNNINRAEAAKMLINAFNLTIPKTTQSESWFSPFFEKMVEKDLLAYNSDSINFEAEKNPSRSEISEQIYRFILESNKREIEPKILEEKTIEVKTEDEVQSATEPFDYEKGKTENNIEIEATAGDLKIEKVDIGRRIIAQSGQKNIRVHALKFIPQSGNVTIGSLQFRRVGNGKFSDFTNLWLEVDGQKISPKISPTEDIVRLDFNSEIEISSGKTFTLKTDLGNSQNTSSRFVLFLPDWIDANTDTKIGFFPLGGIDIVVK